MVFLFSYGDFEWIFQVREMRIWKIVWLNMTNHEVKKRIEKVINNDHDGIGLTLRQTAGGKK